MLLIVATGIVNHINTDIEGGHDYKISVDDEVTYDCNLLVDNSDALCDKRKISGTFSNYPSAEFRYSTVDINGDNFDYQIQKTVDSSLYQTDDFDLVKPSKGIDSEARLILYNYYLNKEVASKTVKIHYNLSAEDITLLAKLHDKWQTQKIAAEKKAKEEAAKRAAEEAKQKAEEEAKQKAEEAAKKKAEEAERQAQAAKEAAEKKAKEEAARYPSEDDTRYICDQAFHKVYPYKGSKVHSILGVHALGKSGQNKMVYKVDDTIQNAFGASHKAVMECVVSRTGDTIKVESLKAY